MSPKPANRSISGGSVLLPLLFLATFSAFAGETGRIKRAKPTPNEAARQISEAVMNDDSLQVGDIVVTDRGYFVFEGIAEDGLTNKFRAIADPSTRSVSPATGRKRLPR